MMKTKGTIDGLNYEVTAWDQPNGFGAQAVISHYDPIVYWEIGEANASSVDDASALAVWDAYKKIATRRAPPEWHVRETNRRNRLEQAARYR